MPDRSFCEFENDEKLTCPICGSQSKWPLQYNRALNIERVLSPQHPRDAYFWSLCRQCGNGYPSFMPDLNALAELWESNRTISEKDEAKEEEIWRYRREISRRGAQRSFRLFMPLMGVKQGSFLDVGCGLGETVMLFSEQGWDAYGIDADPNMLPIHQAIGIQSEIGQVESITLDKKFDLIQIAHAVYFVSNVMTFIESLRSRLNDNGLLCIVLANFMSSDDNGLPGYAHSFFPTAGSMRYLLAVAGYEAIFCQKSSGSIFIAARPGRVALPAVHPRVIRVGYQTKSLRYAIIGKPLTLLKTVAKDILRRLKLRQ